MFKITLWVWLLKNDKSMLSSKQTYYSPYMYAFLEAVKENRILSPFYKWLISGGGTPIETLYGDVPPKWVGFWQKKSLNMGPNFGPKIPKHGSIF